MIKVCHVTTVHKINDVRIYHKQAKSSAKLFDTTVIGFDDDPILLSDASVRIINFGGKEKNIFKRIIKTYPVLMRDAITRRSDIIHIHDPELIPYGIFLKILGRCVIYDVHEDYPRQNLYKKKIPKILRPVVSSVIEIFEALCSRLIFDAVTVPTDSLKNRFDRYAAKTKILANYPIVEGDLDSPSPSPWQDRENMIAYVGPIFRHRGLKEFIDALPLIQNKVKFILAGVISDKNYYLELEASDGWKYVEYKGVLDRRGVNDVLSKSKIGIVADYPLAHYQAALSTKMYEYMANGALIYLTNIQIHKNFVRDNPVGCIYNLFNAHELAEGVDKILNDEDGSVKMSDLAIDLALSKYSWKTQENELHDLYRDLKFYENH